MIILANQPNFVTSSHTCKLKMWSRPRNGQWMQLGVVKNHKMAKKDLKLSHFTHTKKIMKENEIFPSNIYSSKDIGSVEYNRLKTAKS